MIRAGSLALLAAGLAGCGGTTGSSAAAPSRSPAATHSQAVDSATRGDQDGQNQNNENNNDQNNQNQGNQNQGNQDQNQGSGGSSSLPAYQPSTVISRTGHHVQLKSAASVAKITAFYQKQLRQGGWKTTVSVRRPEIGKFVAWRGSNGVTVVINTAGPVGTMVSVSSYQRNG